MDTPILDPNIALLCGWLARLMKQGGVRLSLLGGVKMRTGAHYALFCSQSGSLSRTLPRKMLKIGIPGEDATPGRCSRSGSMIKMFAQDGVAR